MKKLVQFCVMFFFIITHAQNTSERLTLNFTDKTLEEIIIQIESQSDYQFFFERDWLGDAKKNGNYSNETIDTILNDLLSDTVINFYVLEGSKVILTKNSAIHDTIPESDEPIRINTEITPPVVVATDQDTEQEAVEEVEKIRN